jgi:hypothetical protein
MVLSPQRGDFNEDLRNLDINALRRQSSGFSLFGEAALTAFLYGYGGFDRPRRPLAPIRVAGSVVCASVSIAAEREGSTDLPGCLAV